LPLFSADREVSISSVHDTARHTAIVKKTICLILVVNLFILVLILN
jgi:hypothetical protein